MTREEFEKRARYETDIFGGEEESTYALWGAIWAYDELMKEVQPLVEALEFYAALNTGREYGNGIASPCIGEKARQALEAYKK